MSKMKFKKHSAIYRNGGNVAEIFDSLKKTFDDVSLFVQF